MLPVLFVHIVFCQAMSEARLRATYTTEGHLLLLQYIYSHVVSFSIVVENLRGVLGDDGKWTHGHRLPMLVGIIACIVNASIPAYLPSGPTTKRRAQHLQMHVSKTSYP